MASASAPVHRDVREPQPQPPGELDHEPSWGEGSASALRMLRSLEQQRRLVQPVG